jgi:hypothetical protein
MCIQLLEARDHLTVLRVAITALHLHNDGLLHFVGNNLADALLPVSAFCGCL